MLVSTQHLITKADGEQEPFLPEKLFQSLVRSGAAPDVADRITFTIQESLHEGDRTRDIYARAFTQLRKQERPLAARYSVKRALLELGPSGYPFEDFVAEIFKTRGYETQTRVMLEGRCVSHELDMVAVRGNERIITEAKYHNSAGLGSDIKVALYVRARFDDIFARGDFRPENTTGLIVTNTKFSEQAEAYAQCAGLTLLAWDYPEKGNLREYIEEANAHPLSCLTTLSRAQKRLLMEQGIVLARQVFLHEPALRELGIDDRRLSAIHAEAEGLAKLRVQ